jgi:hypothetical protein
VPKHIEREVLERVRTRLGALPRYVDTSDKLGVDQFLREITPLLRKGLKAKWPTKALVDLILSEGAEISERSLLRHVRSLKDRQSKRPRSGAALPPKTSAEPIEIGHGQKPVSSGSAFQRRKF